MERVSKNRHFEKFISMASEKLQRALITSPQDSHILMRTGDLLFEQVRRIFDSITDSDTAPQQDIIKAKDLIKQASEKYNTATKYVLSGDKGRISCQLALLSLFDLNLQKIKTPLRLKQVATPLQTALQHNAKYLDTYLEQIFTRSKNKRFIETALFVCQQSSPLTDMLTSCMSLYDITSLDLSHTHLTDELVGWIANCKYIISFQLNGCTELVEPPMDKFPKLEELYINECTKITRLRVPTSLKVHHIYVHFIVRC